MRTAWTPRTNEGINILLPASRCSMYIINSLKHPSSRPRPAAAWRHSKETLKTTKWRESRTRRRTMCFDVSSSVTFKSEAAEIKRQRRKRMMTLNVSLNIFKHLSGKNPRRTMTLFSVLSEVRPTRIMHKSSGGKHEQWPLWVTQLCNNGQQLALSWGYFEDPVDQPDQFFFCWMAHLGLLVPVPQTGSYWWSMMTWGASRSSSLIRDHYILISLPSLCPPHIFL